ncbi:heavy-metal-associated domain-containing protein [Tenacibaculum adriaticum]|uniref:Heavy-metal-associated domain-containing protein n=1 Tax=Tenacibaculum adriaticum TaxID=413713 RepID=A0A5S5DYV2_9FLAO|nr:cation transporter [Tenacibaculum adriaticum]TYP99942.1 heavy-metal-associated domain-containing protein [Tenacibaculum adriaticum]
MKIQKILFALAIAGFVFTGCKKEAEKTETKTEVKEVLAENTKELSLNISGMTCEIGCAKTIESKLAKKEGVLEAKVVFNDSIATIKYDASKVDKTNLIAFVEGVGTGDTYKAIEATKKNCNPAECTKTCTEKTTAKTCSADCKKECCAKKEAKTCTADCKKECCTTKKA